MNMLPSIQTLNDPSLLKSYFYSSGEQASKELALPQAESKLFFLIFFLPRFLLNNAAFYVFTSLASLFTVCHLTTAAQICTLFTKHANANLKALNKTPAILLCRARNYLQLPCIGIARYSSSDIHHPQIEAALYTDHFFKVNGLCRGMNDWFTFLFFKVQKHGIFKNDIETALAVSKQFEQGANYQAALLQNFYFEFCHTLLDFSCTDANSFVSKWTRVAKNIYEILTKKKVFYRSFDLYHPSVTTLKQNPQVFSKQLDTLKDGLYHIYFPAHTVTYIKTGKTNLLWDSNLGLIKTSSIPTPLFSSYLKPVPYPGNPSSIIQNVMIYKITPKASS